MALNYDQLKVEIENDPENLGYAALVEAGRDQDVANVLNRRDRSGHKLVDLWAVKLAAIENGFWPKIRVAATSHPVDQIKAVAQTVLDYVDDQRFSTIDMHRASTAAMLDALVEGQVITLQEGDTLTALADTLVSRAEEIELVEQGSNVTAGDVAKALRG